MARRVGDIQVISTLTARAERLYCIMIGEASFPGTVVCSDMDDNRAICQLSHLRDLYQLSFDAHIQGG